jgi:hypothetical protein
MEVQLDRYRIQGNTYRTQSRSRSPRDDFRYAVGRVNFFGATHVSLTHLDLQRQALGRPPAIIMMAAAFAFALFMRFTADASDTYFQHLRHPRQAA